jgi:hypothetical protein
MEQAMTPQLTAEQARPEQIVCAALRSGDIVICGVRHFDMIMRDAIVRANLQGFEWEQGFITTKHRFLNRREALSMVEQNGQLTQERRAKLPELYSEDLY